VSGAHSQCSPQQSVVMPQCCNKDECNGVDLQDSDLKLCLGCTRGSNENVLYCNVCYDSIHSVMPMSVRKGHSLIPYVDENLCQCEKRFPLDSYCVECDEHICNFCCKW
jgi:hypothetical protein